MAMNAPIQGTAADIIKLAMVKVHRALQGEQARLILQVHDELIVETPEADAAQVRAMMRAEMESVMKLAVPLTVDVSLGKTWYDAK